MEGERFTDGEKGKSHSFGGEMEGGRFTDGEKGMPPPSSFGGEMEREKKSDGEMEDGELLNESESSDGEMTITDDVEVMDTVELSKRVSILERCYDMLED